MQPGSAKAVRQRDESALVTPKPAPQGPIAKPGSPFADRLRNWRERLLSRLLELLEPPHRDI